MPANLTSSFFSALFIGLIPGQLDPSTASLATSKLYEKCLWGVKKKLTKEAGQNFSNDYMAGSPAGQLLIDILRALVFKISMGKFRKRLTMQHTASRDRH